MDKLHFRTREGEIQQKIDFLKQELKDLENEYISSNQKFPIGAKVSITTTKQTSGSFFDDTRTLIPESKRYAYVSGYEIRYGEIIPILFKAKKDGTISKNRNYVSFERVIIKEV